MSDHPDDTVPDGTDLRVDGADGPEEARGAITARLDDIESRPLATRAEAFGEIHDDLSAVLEGTTGDAGQGGR